MKRTKSDSVKDDFSVVGKSGRQRMESSTSRSQNDRIGVLHRSIGNQGIQALTPDEFIQPNVTISKPGDESEREANRAADLVMQMSEVDKRPSLFSGIFRSADDDTKNSELRDSTSQIESLNNGRPLPPNTRSYFEPRFGHDLSNVRVHTDTDADKAAKSINADAFTIGRDIAFRHGRFNPRNTSGKRLIAHELAHVIQQGTRSGQPIIQREAGTAVTAAAWATVGSAGFSVAQAAIQNSAGDTSYSFDEVEGTIFYGNQQEEYQTKHKYPITDGSKYISVWLGARNDKNMGIKFRVDYRHDGYSTGSISCSLVDAWDGVGWSGNVRIELTPITSRPATVRVNANLSGSSLTSTYSGSVTFDLSAKDSLEAKEHEGDINYQAPEASGFSSVTRDSIPYVPGL